MKLDEFYSLSREECFERIKGECRSQAIKGLFIGVLVLLIIMYDSYSYPELRLISNCLLSIACIAVGWIVVNNLRFLLRLRSVNTPEELLHLYKKRLGNDRRTIYLVMLALIILYPPMWYKYFYISHKWLFIDLTMGIALIAMLVYAFFDDYNIDRYTSRRDEEIVDRLEDLINIT